MDVFKILAIVSPFISAILTALVTYRFTIKNKKFDILYQNKIPAFKDVATELINYKKYCLGQAASYQGNEFSPYYDEGEGTLTHRKKIAEVAEMNVLFLSTKSKVLIGNLINNMSIACNIELYIAAGKESEFPELDKSYEDTASQVDEIIEELYRELRLK